jgi:hypothetical protein
VEGLYLYITTSTPQQLAARQAARLKEAESTLAARMAWADKQCAAARGAGLYDRVIVDTSLQVGGGGGAGQGVQCWTLGIHSMVMMFGLYREHGGLQTPWISP